MSQMRTKNPHNPVRINPHCMEVIEKSGATRRDRTGDLLITNQPLYQLS